jgi:hypothetical protein
VPAHDAVGRFQPKRAAARARHGWLHQVHGAQQSLACGNAAARSTPPIARSARTFARDDSAARESDGSVVPARMPRLW